MNADAAVSDRSSEPVTSLPTRTRLRRLVVILLGPLWVRTFRDPVRDGHLRLQGLSRAGRSTPSTSGRKAT